MTGTIMTPTPDADIARLALIEAVRSQGDTLARFAVSFEKISDQFAEMAKDVAVLKSQDMKNEMALIRQTVDMAMRSHDAKVEASELAWRAEVKATNERINSLLAASQTDRQNLWISIENIKGKIVPIVAALTFAAGLAAAWVKDIIR